MLKNNEDQDGNELDDEKEYEEIEVLYQFKDLIKDILNIDDLDIKGFLSYYYGVGYYICFDYKDNGWELYIPTNPSFEEFKIYGKRAFQLSLLHHDSEYCTSVFDSTFFVKDLTDIMRRAVEKYCKDERQD